MTTRLASLQLACDKERVAGSPTPKSQLESPEVTPARVRPRRVDRPRGNVLRGDGPQEARCGQESRMTTWWSQPHPRVRAEPDAPPGDGTATAWAATGPTARRQS